MLTSGFDFGGVDFTADHGAKGHFWPQLCANRHGQCRLGEKVGGNKKNEQKDASGVSDVETSNEKKRKRMNDTEL